MKDLEKENGRLKKVAELTLDKRILKEEISERRACRTIGQPRPTQRKPHQVRDDEAGVRSPQAIPSRSILNSHQSAAR